MRDLLASQSIVRELLAEEEAPQVSFIGSLSPQQGVPYALTMVRELLGDESPRNARNVGQYFEQLRDVVESTGVFVLLKGNLGSHHTSLDTDVFRGLSLADPFAPFIIVNDNDARAAWCFTLLHEFVHLLLGSKPCDGGHNNIKVEQFCDEVASLFLLPDQPVREFRATHSGLGTAITDLARDWKVSRTLVTYRLLQKGKIGRSDCHRLVQDFRRTWLSERQRQRDRNTKPEGGGPSYYAVKRHRAGKALLNLVSRFQSEGSLPTNRAAVVLGVKPTQVQPMLAR